MLLTSSCVAGLLLEAVAVSCIFPPSACYLAIALCRCMNIPARYCTGYLGDIGVPVALRIKGKTFGLRAQRNQVPGGNLSARINLGPLLGLNHLEPLGKRSLPILKFASFLSASAPSGLRSEEPMLRSQR